MRSLLKLQQYGVGSRYCAAIRTLLLFVAPVCHAQRGSGETAYVAVTDRREQVPGLSAEFGHLLQQIQKNVQPPAHENRVICWRCCHKGRRFMPQCRTTAKQQQALDVFHSELKSSAVLRDWWEHGEVSSNGVKIEDALKKVSQLAAYLDDEIVIARCVERR